MKYKANTRRKAIDYENYLVKYWKEHQTFEKSVSFRPKDNSYVFYDGPPFITGVPHTGTLLSSLVKDAVPRYWTMKGKRVERVWGWDCHGLPAEVYTEKKFGIKDRREIGTKISLADYIITCRNNMVQTGSEWEDTIDRIGRWVDFKGAYKTMDKPYMESVWWAFKQLHEKGKIYEGERVLLYCTRDATPISKAEVAMDNSYQVITDPSVYVKFKLKGTNKYVLAWTTTPWTLNANTAVVVNKDINYQEFKTTDGDVLIVAENRMADVLAAAIPKANLGDNFLDSSYPMRTFKGVELVGLAYEPLFANRGKNAHKIWHADFVTDEEGTGIAHQAPGYGEDDYNFAKAHKIPFVLDTDDEGYYIEGPWKGKQIWEVNKQIAKELNEQGVVWKIEYIQHEYPHCHRCGTKLQYRAHPSWFMDVDGQRTEMLEQNANINWFPQHIKHGRFEKTVESAPDWNLSRDRFWATAMPVWKGKDNNGKELVKVIGSYAELKELSGVELEDYHRPWIDDVTFTIDGVKYERIDKVLDCWFESGSMPFAQFHYPFENVEKFEENFPGDFIVEYVGQVRAWFYYVHAVSVGLFGKNAFRNVIVTGSLLGSDGRKLSKSLGNFTDPNIVMDLYSADALRFTLLASPVVAGEDVTLKDKDIADVNRKLAMVWNMYDFFTLYASVDGWEWDGKLLDTSEACKSPLDTWIVSRVHQVIQEVDRHMQAYDLPNAVKPLLPLLDDASNWYVRRSRKRFWKSENDGDKEQAYRTLHYVLVRLSEVMAPFTPFLAEELFLKLTGDELGESVHLRDWPEVGHVNELLVDHMKQVRELINDGLSQRAKATIKVRQPLRSAIVRGRMATDLQPYEDIFTEELNVKQLILGNLVAAESSTIELDLELDDELRQEGLMREVIRQVQESRKKAGLNVDDRIYLSLQSDDAALSSAIKTHEATILEETLAVGLTSDTADMHHETAKVEGHTLDVFVRKS